MEMSENNEMMCFCLGLGLGVAAGMLFAPKSGAETRRLIQDKANESSDYLKSQADQVVNTANDVVDRGAKTIRHKKENVVAAMEAGKAAYREAAATTPN
jgi:gas vesicle protein